MEIIKVRKSKGKRSLNTNFNAIYHVASLCPKDDMKPVFQYVYSTGKEIVSTDSRSLHTAKVEMKPGFYMVVICTNRLVLLHYEGEKIEGLTFPSYETVIPKDYESYAKKEIDFYPSIGGTGHSKAYTNIIRHIGRKQLTIDFGRLKTFTGQWDFYCDNSEYDINIMKPFVFVSKDKLCFALIMPMQIRES